jgi:hypothetical protein
MRADGDAQLTGKWLWNRHYSRYTSRSKRRVKPASSSDSPLHERPECLDRHGPLSTVAQLVASVACRGDVCPRVAAPFTDWDEMLGGTPKGLRLAQRKIVSGDERLWI